MLDTTLGLRHGDRVLQSLMRIGQDHKKGTILLLRLQGLADFYRHHGYETGGVLLRSYAEAIETTLRNVPGVIRINPNKEQVLARLAGGEFVVLIPDMTDDQGMVGPLSRLLEATRGAIAADERLKLINTRIGMATWPKDGASPDVILKAASLACDYFSMSEDGGPGTIMAAVVRAREQARLEYELHHAIERGQLQLHYQPKLSIPDGRIVGFEALLRWQHQKSMFVPPAIFIPIAERTGLIAQLGDWVIERAAEQIAQWRSDGLGLVQVAVNVSPQQMLTGDVLSSIRGACTRHIVEPLFLQVELTESCLIDDAESAMKLLAEIRRLGCQIALDDFGTGYSSLSYLRRLPLDILKIDRSFISGIGEAQGDSNLAFNILGIGRSLGLKVIAEGVASAAQWDALCRWRCTEAQGYLISQPVPAAAVAPMWQHGRWDGAAHKLRLPAASAAQTAA
jgi:EAL domain-containing protein (putative c-di-GMP-specific phosphodiesterase class I)